jgi:hypothetical protein
LDGFDHQLFISSHRSKVLGSSLEKFVFVLDLLAFELFSARTDLEEVDELLSRGCTVRYTPFYGVVGLVGELTLTALLRGRPGLERAVRFRPGSTSFCYGSHPLSD